MELKDATGWVTGDAIDFLEIDRYPMTVQWSDEDESYIALSPQWPGLSAFGPTREEAIREAGVALHGMLKTAIDHQMVIPEPDRFEQKGNRDA